MQSSRRSRRFRPDTLDILESRELLSAGPPASLPRHLPNIRVAEFAYNPHTFTAFDDKLLTNYVDMVFTDPEYAPRIRSVAPNTPVLIYSNVTNIYGGLLVDWLNYADAHGFDREAAFYHASHALPWNGNGASTRPVAWFWNILRSDSPSDTPSEVTWMAYDAGAPGVTFGAMGGSVELSYPDRFREINVSLKSPASGGWGAVLEYPTAVDGSGNPTGWATLNPIGDTTSGLTQSGRITFDPPADWVPASINGSGRLFYVRFRTATAGTAPVAATILGRDFSGANGGTSGTIPAFDAAADTDHDGYLNDAEYANRAAGKDARFLYESRAFTIYGPMRFAANPTVPYRQWAADYQLRYLNANPAATGSMLDNSADYPHFDYTAADLLEDPTTHGAGYAATIEAINNAIAPRWVTGGPYTDLIQATPIYGVEFLLRPMSANYLRFEDVVSWVKGWQATTTPAPYGVIDSSPEGGSPTDPRTQMGALAYYYLIADDRTFFQVFGGWNPESAWTDHWWDAIAYDVGQPVGAMSLFATGADPGNPAATYKVYQRAYANALVLYKPLSFADWSVTASTGDETATIHQLDGTYRLLQADGSLGAPVTSVSLRNGEGAILVRDPSVPAAMGDRYTTAQDTALTVSAPGVLGNDTTPIGQSLHAVLVSGPADGTLALNSDGSFVYTPKAGFSGSDSFTYSAVDGTGASTSATVALTVKPPIPPGAGGTIFTAAAVPTVADVGPDASVEIGVRFSSDADGYITGIRFYKSSANVGTHVGNLWDGTGNLLATATFAAETDSGWQRVDFSSPVAITAGTTYVASYHTDSGHYAGDHYAFATPYNGGGHLTVPTGGGVFSYGPAGTFPKSGYLNSNYWVDVNFQSVTTFFAPAAAPTVADAGPDSSVEVGMRFSSDVDGYVTGVRFYKGAGNTGTHVGNLWDSTGKLLATVTFAGESDSGWQEARFSSPVKILAGQTYVVSYHTDSGHYADDYSAFAAPQSSGHLTVAAGGGVFGYGPAGTFPAESYRNSNYWVDVDFLPAASA